MTPHEQSIDVERLKQQVVQMLAQFEDSEEDDNDMLENTINTLRDLDLETEQDKIDPESYFNAVPMSKDYAPYPNKMHMLLNILDNLPRLQMSSNQLKMILWILTECNVNNVPSYAAFRALQDRLRTLCGRFCQSREGLASRTQKEYKPSKLTPMYARGLQQLYIEEVAELDNRKIVLPPAWIKRGGILCADSYEIKTAVTGWEIGHNVQSVPATELSPTPTQRKCSSSFVLLLVTIERAINSVGVGVIWILKRSSHSNHPLPPLPTKTFIMEHSTPSALWMILIPLVATAVIALAATATKMGVVEGACRGVYKVLGSLFDVAQNTVFVVVVCGPFSLGGDILKVYRYRHPLPFTCVRETSGMA
ncbi:hypothetical protein C8F04DRAFT_1256642 [Mycena alexandri]|uniref:Uncharacterized protein n=1 Tax=Mycena alexandri TaxID=1745969 RepID=A0AAD6T5L9_9AGAR|nr:hypothetical protein C8F04DRAFT_1256642 [Mycena alexandri]